jgi:hypothetical protein
LLFRPNAASAGLPSEEFRSQLSRRLLGCVAPTLLFFVLLAMGGFVSSVVAPDLSYYEESAIPQFGRIYLEYVIPYAVANFFCVPAVVSITTEIASMRLSRELDALEVLGLDPSEVAFVPKATALIFVAPLFCFLILFCGLAGVWLGSNYLLGKPFQDFVGIFLADVRSATYAKDTCQSRSDYLLYGDGGRNIWVLAKARRGPQLGRLSDRACPNHRQSCRNTRQPAALGH